MYIFSGIMFPFAVLVYWLTNNACSLARSLFQVYKFPTPVPVQLRKGNSRSSFGECSSRQGRTAFVEERELEKTRQKPLFVWSGDTSASSPSRLEESQEKVTRLETSI